MTEPSSLSTEQAIGPFPKKLGQYILHRCLAQGGMGTVYLATHINLKTPVALKTLRASQLETPDALARFYREMAAIGGLVHPHIVRALDAGELQGMHYLAMEYLVGRNLGRILEKHGPFPVPDACEVIRQAANGLSAIHKAGLVHRDLKPTNLLLTPEGTVKILDLGLARLMNESNDATNDADLTPTGTTLGTLDYLAPEQIQGAHRVDIRADIYSLGCTLYKLLCGRAPFARPEYDSVPKKLLAHCQEPPPPLSDSIIIPPPLWEVLQKMLTKEPVNRFQIPADLETALIPFTTDHDLTALEGDASFREELREFSELSSGRISSADVDTLVIRHLVSALPHTDSQTAQEQTGIPSRQSKRKWVGMILALCLLLVGFAAWIGLPHFGVDQDPHSSPQPLGGDLLPKSPVPLEQVDNTKPVPEIDVPVPGFLNLPIPNFDQEVPLQWYRLLQTSPFPLEMVDPDGLSTFDFQQERQQLIVRSEGMHLFLLGETEAENYQIQIGISQTQWENGAGFFFGLHPSQGPNGEPTWEYQLLQIEHNGQRTGGYGFSLVRRKGTCTQNASKISHLMHMGVGGEEFEFPVHGEMTLDIIVRRGHLAEVKFNNAPLTKLLSPQANKWFTREHTRGGFGTFNYSNDAVFRNAQFKLLNP